MGKRTAQTGFEDWDEVRDIDREVVDGRVTKRSGPTKARRRNRRYANRILRAQLHSDGSELVDDLD